MKTSPYQGMTLLITLLMFPQIVETMYSPALADIAETFHATPQQAAQTLSVYFFGFALGVLVWGVLCDLLGRRMALLLGLLCYAIGAVAAGFSEQLIGLLIARVMMAFGAASGSIVTQTLFRDRYSGAELIRIFSFAGVALAISPAVGVYSGGLLVSFGGYQAVLIALVGLALCLLIWTCCTLKETRPTDAVRPHFASVMARMVKDRQIWLLSFLIALFNVQLFAYYSKAPFIFQQQEVSIALFSLTGIVLATGSLLGAQLNSRLLAYKVSTSKLLMLACGLNFSGACALMVLEPSLWFLLPMTLVMVSYASAIPLILSLALTAYSDCRGIAGAFLGFIYYLLIALGLVVANHAVSLGGVLLTGAMIIYPLGRLFLKSLNDIKETLKP